MKSLFLPVAAALLWLGLPSSLFAATPRVLKSPTDAIQYARTADRPLILFALIDASDGSRNFAKLFNDNALKLKGEEFAVALCDASRKENLTLFQTKFEQNPAMLPSVLITDAQGAMKAPALAGVQAQDDYDRMIHAALVAAGLRKENEPIISSTTGEVIEGSSNVFRIMKDEVSAGAKVISEYRDWALKNGESFHGALLKAEGADGTFLTDSGDERSLNFNDLSEEDIAFLQTLLGGG
ncbi:MAG: hypothetical protein AAGJ31_05195 [Verrucomicrobiota bacterium]